MRLVGSLLVVLCLAAAVAAESDSVYDQLFSEEGAEDGWVDIHAEKPSIEETGAATSTVSHGTDAEDDVEMHDTNTVNEHNPAASFWHIDDAEESEDDVDEHFAVDDDIDESKYGIPAPKATPIPAPKDAPKKTLTAVKRNANRKQANHQERQALYLVSQLNATAVSLAQTTRSELAAANKALKAAVADSKKKVAAYKAAVAKLRKSKASIVAKHQEVVSLVHKCEAVTKAAAKKTSLLASIEKKLQNLHEAREEVGHTAAVAKEHARLAKLVADVATSEDDEDDDSVDVTELIDAKPTLSYDQRKQRVAATISKLRSKAVLRAQKCSDKVDSLQVQEKALRKAYRSLIAPARAARSAAVVAARNKAVEKQRAATLLAVLKRERAFVREQRGNIGALRDNIPVEAKLIKRRIHDLSVKLHDVVQHTSCVEELARCAYDVGTLTSQKKIKSNATPKFLSVSGDKCPQALKQCQAALKIAVNESINDA